jgi:cysteine synthase A
MAISDQLESRNLVGSNDCKDAWLFNDFSSPPQERDEPPCSDEMKELLPQYDSITRLVGSTSGIVYKAHHAQLDRFEAIKLLPLWGSRILDVGEQLLYESKALGKLNHPNIVAVYHAGEVVGFYYLTMEFIHGYDLRQVMSAEEMGPREVIAIILQICDAMQYAHDRGVVHLDIKPENVIRAKSGQLKIVDFGLASLGQQGFGRQKIQNAGTWGYMSPEQRQNSQKVDARSDIYSVGILFHELLTGEIPRFLQANEPSFNPDGIDEDTARVLSRALAENPDARYPNMTAFARDVQALTGRRRGRPQMPILPARWTAREAISEQSEPFPGFCRFLDRVAPTPLVPIQFGGDAPEIWCKLEFLNPSGSIKDRVARYVLERAWRAGKIKRDSVVIEASSGSTAISYAMVCAQMGLKFIAIIHGRATSVVPAIIEAYGGRVERVQGGLAEAIARVEALGVEMGAFLPRQFSNPDSVETHRVWTAAEVAQQIRGGIDAVVSCVGTGGTFIGLYKGISDAGHTVQPFVAKPTKEDVLEAPLECCSLHFNDNVPGTADGVSELYREWESQCPQNVTEISVSGEDILKTTRRLIRLGFPVGPTSGLNYRAAVEVARVLKGRTVVTVFPDRMEKYTSHELFSGWSSQEAREKIGSER